MRETGMMCDHHYGLILNDQLRIWYLTAPHFVFNILDIAKPCSIHTQSESEDVKTSSSIHDIILKLKVFFSRLVSWLVFTICLAIAMNFTCLNRFLFLSKCPKAGTFVHYNMLVCFFQLQSNWLKFKLVSCTKISL